MNVLRSVALSAFALCAAALAQPLGAAELSGSFSPAPGTYNLTNGSADWVHFGFIPIELDRKAGVAQQITDYTPLNGAPRLPLSQSAASLFGGL